MMKRTNEEIVVGSDSDEEHEGGVVKPPAKKAKRKCGWEWTEMIEPDDVDTGKPQKTLSMGLENAH